MRKGSSHKWLYVGTWNERKTAPGVWSFRFKASKSQRGRPGVGVGSRYRWKISGVQSAVKTRSGRYMTDMRGTKRLLSARPKGRVY